MSEPAVTHRFWREAALPQFEARSVADGRKVCYAKHAHETFSIGAITAGACDYFNGKIRRSEQGALVLMNPGDTHACNPVADQAWSYRMLYVDVGWLGRMQQALGVDQVGGFRPLDAAMSRHPGLFSGFNAMFTLLCDAGREPLEKDIAAAAFFGELHPLLGLAPAVAESNLRLERAAEYIAAHCAQSLRLEDISREAGLSASYLIRAFKQRYGVTPHGFLLSQRVSLARRLVRGGLPLAQVAQDAGFSDQAHLQKVFKQYVAATPGQYRAG
ncbi:AraC family transcriptional regulator [Chromobacterium sp. LK1]|uniref:AraC family transcriptional regulator n=1 Tax=Chromobacterium sp. LK1 TaxID=1628193 RepID=UPI00065448A3|nr:AraC family transcriptional regulator [Chromobacterium sp. LK1]KMN34943.1 AraC family transcriptional regulator [Chromobacterium sp. LK1]